MTAGSIEKFTWSPEHAVWDVSTESRAWDEALHPRAPDGQFMAYDEEKDTGTGYGKKGGDADVRALQQALNKLGFTDSKGNKLDADGMLGPLTTSAVKKLQASLGLKADGKVSPKLLKQILSMKPGDLKKGTLKPAGVTSQQDTKDSGKKRPGVQSKQDTSSSSGGKKLRPAGATSQQDTKKTKVQSLQETGRNADPKVLEARSDWDPTKHPRGPDGKFTGSNGFDALADAVASGDIADVKELSGGNVAESVALVTFGDGRLAVAKQMRTRPEVDSEILTSHVGRAIGAPVPAVIPSPELDAGVNGVWMEHASGQTAMQTNRTDFMRTVTAQNSAAGKRLGLLDLITNNVDRHAGNWVIDDDGAPIGIDHSGIEMGRHVGGDLDPGVAASPFVQQHWADRTDLADNDLSADEVEDLRNRLQELRGRFTDLGREDWHDRMMERFEQVAAHATGGAR